MFRTLRYRNYRLFFAGQLTSLAGTWMSLVAMGWLVYRLTGDPLMLGLVGFCMHVPTFLLSPVAGVLVDRWNRRTMMVAAQSTDMAAMLVLAALTLSGEVQLWHVFTTCVVLGLVKAFDIPARHALVVEIVEDRGDLSNAIALNSSMFHGARLIGPVLGGAIIPLVGENGEGVCFLIDGLSYIAVITSLLLLRLPPGPEPATRKHLLHDMAEGLRYVVGFGPMRSLMGLMAVLALLGVPYMTLLPVFAEAVLGGDSRTYGLLMAASGGGALMGALYLAARRSVLGLGRAIAACTVCFGAALLLFSLSRQLWLSMALLVAAGSLSMVTMAGTNTIIQMLVDDVMRGRVMSFFAMTFMGAMPLGSLLAGQLARVFGAPATVMLCGVACVIAGLTFGYRLPALRALARPIYIERGIILPTGAAPRAET